MQGQAGQDEVEMIDLKDRIVIPPGFDPGALGTSWLCGTAVVSCAHCLVNQLSPLRGGDEKGRGRLLRRAYTEYGREESEAFKANEAFPVDVEGSIASESYEGIGAQQRDRRAPPRLRRWRVRALGGIVRRFVTASIGRREANEVRWS